MENETTDTLTYCTPFRCVNCNKKIHITLYHNLELNYQLEIRCSTIVGMEEFNLSLKDEGEIAKSIDLIEKKIQEKCVKSIYTIARSGLLIPKPELNLLDMHFMMLGSCLDYCCRNKLIYIDDENTNRT